MGKNKERKKKRGLIHITVGKKIYIYIYIYIEREVGDDRQKKRKDERRWI